MGMHGKGGGGGGLDPFKQEVPSLSRITMTVV